MGSKKQNISELRGLLSADDNGQEYKRQDDLKAVRELGSLMDAEELQAYISYRRHQEIIVESKQLQRKEHLNPYRDLPDDILGRIRVHEHDLIAKGAMAELARRSLIEFTIYTYPGYSVNWHHREYAKKLDDFMAGTIKKLMVFMPPQHGKSELCSRRMPAMMLGNNPNLKIAIVSYNHPFASKFNRDVQRIIDSDAYRHLFPETTLNTKNIRTVVGSYLRNSDEFEVVGYRGGLVSVGTGGGLTGRPVDILIIDDPYKDQKEAWSPTMRQSTQDWYDTVADSRLNNKSQQLLTLTRWHEDDLAGHILKNEPNDWEVVRFPALKEGAPNHYDERKLGEALWPEMHSQERMESAKRRNAFVFQALYQQNPQPAEGLLFPPDSLHYYERDDIADISFDSIVAVSDVADRGSDYYCMIIAGIHSNKIYVLDVIYTQEPVKVTIPLTLGKLAEWRPARHRIESNNGGSIFAYEIREKKTTPTIIEEKVTSTNKATRILMASGQIIEYCLFREDCAPGSQYEEYVSALTKYLIAGGNAHDDAPDATTMLIELIHPIVSPFEFRILNNEPDKSGFIKRAMNRLSGGRRRE